MISEKQSMPYNPKDFKKVVTYKKNIGIHAFRMNITHLAVRGLMSMTRSLMAFHEFSTNQHKQTAIEIDLSSMFDCSIFKSDHEILQTDLNQLQTWSDKWQMEFNVSKCVHLQITNKIKPNPHKYSLFG